MSRAKRLLHAATVAFAVAALIGGPAAPLLADPEEVLVSATLAQGFNPKSIDAKTGTTIVWRNDEAASPNLAVDVPFGKHQIVADDGSFESPVLLSKASWSLTFNAPGTFAYHCSIHAQLMTGSLSITGPVIKPEPLERTVKIVEPDPNDTLSWGYDPGSVVVKPGTSVTWRNEGTQTHSVTADDGSFDSGNLAPGDTFIFTFKNSAGVRYHCTPHDWMKGLVRMAGGRPPPPPPPAKNQGNTGSPPAPTQERAGSGPTIFGVNVVEPNSSDPNSWGFAPVELTARVGDTVKWTNTGSTIHSVTSDSGAFDSGNLDPGATFQFVLNKTGTFTYHCTPHSWMKAAVIVRVASAAVPDQPRADGGAVPPPTPGDTTAPPDDPATVDDDDPAASDRRALALGAGAAIVVLGAAFIVPVVFDRRRRIPSLPKQLDLTDAREPLHVG